MTEIPVVAAVIERDGRVLVGQRPLEKRHGGLWEFPGGKVDPGEGPEEAARRELAEELSLRVTSVGECLFSITDEASPYRIDFYGVVAEGDPVAHEHAALGWFTPVELGTVDLAPADRAFSEWLKERV
ncbi:MAG: (deoxy)nucleoside triphosphate pyrophosphohydrolase [Gemmatimonadota bacterium]